VWFFGAMPSLREDGVRKPAACWRVLCAAKKLAGGGDSEVFASVLMPRLGGTLGNQTVYSSDGCRRKMSWHVKESSPFTRGVLGSKLDRGFRSFGANDNGDRMSEGWLIELERE
jgi:hypothetical protein